MTLLSIVLATLLGGLLSVVVAASLTVAVLGRVVRHLVSLSAGVLLSTALLHVLPEAFDSGVPPPTLATTLPASRSACAAAALSPGSTPARKPSMPSSSATAPAPPRLSPAVACRRWCVPASASARQGRRCRRLGGRGFGTASLTMRTPASPMTRR